MSSEKKLRELRENSFVEGDLHPTGCLFYQRGGGHAGGRARVEDADAPAGDAEVLAEAPHDMHVRRERFEERGRRRVALPAGRARSAGAVRAPLSWVGCARRRAALRGAAGRGGVRRRCDLQGTPLLEVTEDGPERDASCPISTG